MNRLSPLKTVFFLCVFCTVAAMAAAVTFATSGVGFKTIVNFDGANGAESTGQLVKAINGSFYGTTLGGGAHGVGTVFQLSPAGTLTTLHSFHHADGANPKAGLIQAIDGDFYGTTNGGGTNNYGTVFKIGLKGRLTTLYSFCSQPNCTDGARPLAGLIQATDGNFYGTTSTGGTTSSACGSLGCGTVFQLSPAGTLTTLHSFHYADGAEPTAGLIQATDGNFYGTTMEGGVNGGNGTVFQITPAGTLTTLYNFCSQPNCTDGAGPPAGLIQATDGNFYGTTEFLGANGFGGTVFQITPAGMLTTFYSFCSQPNCTDAAQPLAGLIQATDGNFYGTTFRGGNNTCFGSGCGTVFKITPAGKFTTLHSFDLTDGLDPQAELFQAPGGNFWGTTPGTVFNLSVGLGPFVKTLPTAGIVGTPVTLLGFQMKDATSVTFNGIPATFQVISSAAITTTVPSGATTGKVEVTTPSRTLTSNVNFQVN